MINRFRHAYLIMKTLKIVLSRIDLYGRSRLQTCRNPCRPHDILTHDGAWNCRIHIVIGINETLENHSLRITKRKHTLSGISLMKNLLKNRAAHFYKLTFFLNKLFKCMIREILYGKLSLL